MRVAQVESSLFRAPPHTFHHVSHRCRHNTSSLPHKLALSSLPYTYIYIGPSSASSSSPSAYTLDVFRPHIYIYTPSSPLAPGSKRGWKIHDPPARESLRGRAGNSLLSLSLSRCPLFVHTLAGARAGPAARRQRAKRTCVCARWYT